MKKITVKTYMTQQASPGFDFMAKWNNNVPMPLRVMVGTVEKETRGMVYMKLHGDIVAEKITTCMKCGRQLTNPVSQYFGLGPECGGHNYVNPFNTEEELRAAISNYREELRNITWEGWVIKSAIIDNEDYTPTDEEIIEEEPVITKVQIRIDKAEKCIGDYALFLSFPYEDNLVRIVRNLPVRFWNKDTKEWEVPAKILDDIKALFSEYNVEVIGELPEEKEVVVPEGFEFKTVPFKHQFEGFKYGLEKNRWLLGDEQGLGKTKQVIDIAVAKKLQNNFKHCLIICGVNGLKWNWVNEIHTHSNEECYILGQRERANKIVIGSNQDKLADVLSLEIVGVDMPYFLITNVETLRNEEIAGALQRMCKNGTINMVAIDEIHKCKNPNSQQGKGILKLQPEVRIAMTGTPLMNTPLDLYIIMKWLGYEKHSFYQFKNHYCILGGYGCYEIIGYKNLKQLEDSLSDIKLRRLKKDVLDLPEKTHIDEYVEMTPKQEQVYIEVTNAIKANIDKIMIAPNPLAELIRMRQATGYTGILSSTVRESAKLDRMEELVEEAIENGKKVVIFSNWTQMTDAICERFNDVRSHNYDYALITGQTNDNERQQIVDRFQNDDNCKVIIGTIGAMGTGLTLTAGTVEIFLDEPWNKALKDQAEDRCHRVGTTENITIYTLLCKNTIDEKIHNLVEQKGIMADAIVDGQIRTNRTDLLNYLLN